jgi:glucose dehydrogenase
VNRADRQTSSGLTVELALATGRERFLHRGSAVERSNGYPFAHPERCAAIRCGMLVAALGASLACKGAVSASQASLHADTGAPPPSGTSAESSGDGQWLRPGKDFASTRFSGLREINTTNVKTLRAIATFSTGVLRGHEAAPIVVGATMYIITPFPNYVYARNQDCRSSGHFIPNRSSPHRA